MNSLCRLLTQRFIILFLLASPLALAHDAKVHHSVGKLPLGDGKVSTAPKRGYVMACNTRFPGGGGAHRVGEWIKEGVWDPAAKPIVPGDVQWAGSAISISTDQDQRIIRANNLPKHTTGSYPIPRDSEAFQYDRNPNRIAEQSILLRLPLYPELAVVPSCVPMGMIGFALSGVAIFNALDLAGRDAPAYEIQDRCNGHPERNGQYHYHDWSPCLPDASGDAGKHSDIVGFMLDGFPIFGLKGENGIVVKNEDLDECHGHTHEVVIEGKKVVTYHYHFTREYPYTIGCFKGKRP
jgi:hypothetical protein